MDHHLPDLTPADLRATLERLHTAGACVPMHDLAWMWDADDRDDPTTDRAKAVCRVCPVRSGCLDYALTAGFRHGVWGGLDLARERPQVNRRRPTPAATDVA